MLARAGAGRRVKLLQRVWVIGVHVSMEDEPPHIQYLVVARDPPIEEPHAVCICLVEVDAGRQR